MPTSMRAIKLNKGDVQPSEENPQTATRTTRPTSVMPISVTSHETTDTVTIYVNGRPTHREEVTRIYVIEPAGHGGCAGNLVPDEGEIRERRWLADMWLGVWALWVVYLAWEWMR